MSGTKRDGHHEHRTHLTGETLRRLIDEGDALHPWDDVSTPSAELRRPSDAALRDLAASLRIAATPATFGTEDRTAREAAAVAAFRAATATIREAPIGSGVVHERWPRLRRARRAVVFSIAAAVLGGGVAVAAGGVPFVGSSPGHDNGTGHPAPGTTVTPSPTTSEPEADLPARPTSGPAGGHASPAQDSGGPSASATPRGALGANERAVHAHCTARARNPHLAPRPLVVAAGGHDRAPALCATLLSTPRPTPDHDKPTAATQETRRPPTPPSNRSGDGMKNPSSKNGHGQAGKGEQGNSGDARGERRGSGGTETPS